MRILQVTQSYYPFLDRGGPAVKVRAMARGLARRGHSITVLTADLGLQKAAHGVDGLLPDRWGWRAEQDSVETIYLLSRAAYRALTWNPRVSAFCRERLASFDIVHIYGFYDLLGPTVARACRRMGVPFVFEPMGMFRPIVRNIPLKWIYRRALGNSMVLGARRVVATSEQEQKELVEEGLPPEQVVVRWNGIEAPACFPVTGTFRRQWHIAEGAKVVLFLGRMVSKKSPELLLEAFARWQSGASGRSSNPPAMLVLAGPQESNGYRKELETLARRLGLDRQVLFTGPLYDDAKWSAYCDADLFVLPSQNENFGNTAAEAIVCGTPVLVTEHCGIAPLVQGRAGEVVPHECAALAGALGRLLDDEALRKHLRQGCVEVARALDWDQPLGETEALYAALLQENRRE